MSTSPAAPVVRSHERVRATNVFRLLLVVASLLSVATATSAITVADDQPAVPPLTATAAPTPDPGTSALVLPPVAAADSVPDNEGCVPGSTGCAPDSLVDAVEEAVTPSGGQSAANPSCRLDTQHRPQGTTGPAITDYLAPDAARVIRVRIEVEDGIAIDTGCFADTVARILNDSRGWGAEGALAFQPVSADDADFRLVLASPDTTDRLCFPLRTGGKYSCRNQRTVVLNVARWESGTEEYSENLEIYRQYLVNHEVGHFLGHEHVRCPGPGEPAPVMMQQTKGLGECLLNGWPTRDER